MFSCIEFTSEVVMAGLTFAYVVATVVLVSVAVRQLRASRLTSVLPFLEAENVRSSRARIMDPETRRTVVTTPFSIENPWDGDLRRDAAEVCAAYNLVGLLAKDGSIDDAIILKHWGHSIIRFRQLLGSYIEAMQLHEGPEYLSGFTWLADRAEKRLGATPWRPKGD